jgi:xyloglucan-specific exo-beta-1,4-glucanase
LINNFDDNLKTKNMKRKLFTMLFVILLNMAFGQNNWEYKSVNLQGMGYVTGLVIHPDIVSAPNLVYAKTDVGGVFRWNNNQQKWIPLLDNIGVLSLLNRNVESIAIDPKNTNKIYAACSVNVLFGDEDKGEVFVSNDQGKNWTATGLGDFGVYMGGNDFYRGSSGERLMVDPNNSSVVFFASRKNGLWRKKGNGLWKEVNIGIPINSEAPGITFVLFDKNAPLINNLSSKIYIGVYGVGVLSSSNAGKNWTLIGGETNPLRAHLSSNNKLYVTYGGKEDDYAGPGSVRRYSNSTWTNITPENNFNKSYSGISTDVYNPENIVVTTNQANMFKSTNGGTNWESISMNFDYFPEHYQWAIDFFRWGTSALVIDPNDVSGNTVWSSNGFAVIKSENYFQPNATWKTVMKNLEEYCGIAVKTPPVVGGAQLFTGQWDGIGHRIVDRNIVPDKRFDDQGNQSISKCTSIDYCQSSPENMAWVGFSQVDNSTLSGVSDDNGLTWNSFQDQSPGKGGIIAISATNSQKMVWHPDNNSGTGFSFTNNKGNTWQPCIGLPSTTWYRDWYSNTLASDRINGNKFYMLYDDGLYNPIKFYRSTNGGANWQVTTAEFAGAQNYSTYATIKTNPYVEGDIWVAFHPNTNIAEWELESNFKLWHSTNSGNSFTALSNVDAAYSVTIGKGSGGATNIYIYGKLNGSSKEGFYVSSNNGVSWQLISNLNRGQWGGTACMEGDLLTENLFYFAPNGCRGFVSAQKVAQDNYLIQANEPTSDIDFVLTSNKINGLANFVVRNTYCTNATIKITNPSGQIVREQSIATHSSYTEGEFDLSNFSTGVYNVTFIGCDQIISKRIVIE